MSAADPTPEQVALLRDVAAGKVHHIFQRSAVYDINTAAGRRVTVPMRRLKAAGWVRPSHPMYTEWLWQLTTAGRAVLDQAGDRR